MKFYIDFSGCCEIDADDRDEAMKKFWQLVKKDLPLPHKLYEIEDVRRKMYFNYEIG